MRIFVFNVLMSLLITSTMQSSSPSSAHTPVGPFSRNGKQEPITESDIPDIIKSYNYLVDKTLLMSETDIYLLDMYIVLCEISVEQAGGNYAGNPQCAKLPMEEANPKNKKARDELTAILAKQPEGSVDEDSSHSSSHSLIDSV